MASSDDEGEAFQDNVSDYKFIDGADEESISFANLPVNWSKEQTYDGKQKQIYLSGKADNGLRPIYIQVTAWKFVLPKEKPEISVLSVQGNWIKLLKPWNPYNSIIRTVLVTLHVLHFAKWNPQRPLRALWDTLNKTLSWFERRPCADDLVDHVPLIREAIKWDEKLTESKLLSAILAKKALEKKSYNEDVKPPFIVDDIDEDEDEGEFQDGDAEEDDKIHENEDGGLEDGEDANESDYSDSEEDDCFDSVCAICDNGGDLYICDGKCMRSFHATVEDGDDSKCDSLGLTDAELEAIKNAPFICDNCKFKKHQCFACGKLGSSDELSNPEVFCCVNGACGYFYHPQCVARLLHPANNAAAEEIQNKIAHGEPFACPIHRCHVCKGLEIRSTKELQFAVCRRCPKAYHRKCLPSEIAFENQNEDGPIQRAWEGLIPNRILIYCLDHEIDENLFTPTREHVIFPGPRQDKKKMLLESNKNKNLSKGRVTAAKDDEGNRFSGKEQKSSNKVLLISKGGGCSGKRLEELPTCSSFKKQKLVGRRNPCEKLKESAADNRGLSSVYRSYAAICGTDPEPVNCSRGATRNDETSIAKNGIPTANITDNSWTLDADSRRRVLTLMKHAASSVTLEEVKKRHKPPSTHMMYSRFSADQVTFGKVQGSIQAVRAALKKLDGGSIQDAKAVCGDELLEQVLKWKERLNVYLSPFLYGMRYTSFGRHFTKMDKLKEIVELLHWYVQDGDMLVDFCCGSNDFSCLMKNKLDEMGKTCSFKNYDILKPKNDFSFERRDWMKVNKRELPDGSKLIMGLNPPFGVNAALANKFIDKALEFKPKLLILIVPRETERLDEKIPPYDLIWEDDQMLAGKSFYLPGSVDVNDKQIEDWNLNAPVLYLWSSPAWTPKHRAIADQHGHVSGALKNHRSNESHNELFENKASTKGEAQDADILHNLENLELKSKEIISQQEGLPCDINSFQADKNHTTAKNHSKSSFKNSDRKGNKKRPQSNVVLKESSSSKLPESHHVSQDVGKTPENHPTGRLETTAQVHYGRGDYKQLNVANQIETPSEVHYRRGDYGQLNQNNLSTFLPLSRTENNGINGMNDSVVYQTQHVETLRQGRSERGDYHHHRQNQFNQSNISAYQPYSSPAEYSENDDVISLVNKYIEGPHGATGVQGFNPRQGFGSRQMSPFDSFGREMHEGYESFRNGHGMLQPIHDFGRQIGSPYGRVQPNQGTAHPFHPAPPYSESSYGLRSMAVNSSYGGLNSTPVSQRYASRLGADHGPMVGMGHRPVAPQPQLPYQGSSSFATSPYHHHYSHHHSQGWLEE